jgi:tetratricopeptide (TPR) repeat protein
MIGELAAPDREAEEPPRIGRYHLQERLGAGGMGVVYAAHDPELDRRVALKLVRPELGKGGLERLLREARALARLSHPNVVPVHDVGIAGEQLFVAMELVSGTTLAGWLAEKRRSWREVVELFSAAGRGLAAAHAAGLVHRDFKPENVLLGTDGRPRVSDFGLAIWGLAVAEPADSEPADSERTVSERAASEPVPSPAVTDRLTRTGTLVGTPAFMASEQYEGRADARSDQFGFCASLFEALYGERAFAGSSIEELTAAVRSGAVREPSEPRRAPGWLRRAVLRGLSPSPDDRFPGMEALLAAIDPRPRARRARVLATGAALAVAASAAFALRGGEDGSAVPAACEASAAARAAIWTASDRAAVERAVLATGKSTAAVTWDRVGKAADELATNLASAEKRLCAELPRTEESRGEFELGMECLADRRKSFAEAIGKLRQIDATSVSRAVFFLHDVQAPAHCADLSELRGLRHVLAKPGGADALAEVRRQLLVDARAAHARGDDGEALRLARRAADRARELDASPMVARALLAVGEYAIAVEGDESAERIYREAAALAEAVAFDDARAVAMVRLMTVIGRQAGREQEGLALEPLVAAAVARSSNPRALQPMLDQAVGHARFQLGQYRAALERLQAALDAVRAVVAPDDPRMPNYLYPVGVALGRVGRFAESAEVLKTAVEAARALHGDDHPEVARHLVRLAAAQSQLGRCDQALPNQERARAILTRSIPHDSTDYLQLLSDIGECHAKENRHAEALREFEGVLAILAQAGRARGADAAFAWSAIGDIHLLQGAPRPANRAYQTAIDMVEDELGRRDIRLAHPLTRMAMVALDDGHPRTATPMAERALAILTSAGADDLTTAEVRFVLANALWHESKARGRARALAEQSLAAFESVGAAGDAAESQVRIWLATHPAPPQRR